MPVGGYNALFVVQRCDAGRFLAFEELEGAPPPVETCVIFLATPAFFTALALSPPPMTVVAPP